MRYVDPDGREIDFSGLGKNNSHIFLQKVNIYSYQQFSLDKNNKIQVDSNNVNENGSLIFGNDLIEAIESEIKIDVFFTKNIKQNGETFPLEGGLTQFFPEEAIALIALHPSGGMYVTDEGELTEANEVIVFIHELSGHLMPKIRNENGNAIEIENSIRLELTPELPLRKPEASHTSF